MSFSSHFRFFILVYEVTKNENRLGDFLYDIFRLQGKTGKTKMKKIIKRQTNYYLIFSFFKNQIWDEKLITQEYLAYFNL